jgi:hypothetical protein
MPKILATHLIESEGNHLIRRINMREETVGKEAAKPFGLEFLEELPSLPAVYADGGKCSTYWCTPKSGGDDLSTTDASGDPCPQ